MAETPNHILKFMASVYPGAGELALASFNEKVTLGDATNALTDLRRQLAQAEQAYHDVGELNNALKEENAKLLKANAAAKAKVLRELADTLADGCQLEATSFIASTGEWMIGRDGLHSLATEAEKETSP